MPDRLVEVVRFVVCSDLHAGDAIAGLKFKPPKERGSFFTENESENLRVKKKE